MKIALVARHASAPSHLSDPYSEDQAVQVSGLGRALAAQGHQVVIYSRKDSASLPGRKALGPRLSAEYLAAGPPAEVPPDVLPRLAGEFADALARSWRRNKPDVVHAYHWTSVLAALAAARHVPVPVVASFGSLSAAEQRHRIAGDCSHARQRLEPALVKGAPAVLATNSDEVAELTRLGAPGARVACVPAGVDLRAFKPGGFSVRRSKQPRLIAFGPLAEYRGLDVMLRCLTELPGTDLVVAGGPPAGELESDHGYRILAKLAAHLGITERVQFLGHVAEEKLPALLRSADLLVSTARYEPQGSAAIRAMACGLPVVATSTGAYRDAVIDGTSGVLVPSERPAAIIRHVRDLLNSPMRLAAYGIAGADRARSRYPWDRVAAETVAWYERTVSQAPNAPASLAAVPAAQATGTAVVMPVRRRPVLRPAGADAA
ncbi:MAG TPA: glycosyltransferase [Streptosporangiaceae bacterium]|nr:glycosyltransferase [Streptosporangiaceae bacterium]